MIEDDGKLCSTIAQTAGQVLVVLQKSGLFRDKVLGQTGDEIANLLISKALGLARPNDAILSEESTDDLGRLHAKRVWIVDPLDGTREYAEGRPDWAVHVAVVVDGKPVAGAVAIPARELTFATCNNVQLAPWSDTSKLRMLVSRSRPCEAAGYVADALKAEIVPMGSAGAKAMAVLRGDAEIYLHCGGQYEWDSCAPAAVAAAAGLHVSRIDGTELRYNQRETYLPDLLICRPEIAHRVLVALSNSGCKS
ncbi:3'(2'),5'-bisphosphate nucleotidase CysQ [Methylobacterium sp. V23]|uniref:3'(2'),5'-bisphosphate nucleotidase CysQ n=1 Tax=Methylobacterium sp. V23 TaxID=2044878 RepID=UPI000CDAE70E|nr:3'(2'),5'-bisphosphate nucleotidase CysQ [Methylobacterium sp. V23]POR39925.1 3'(2'),5'-bisphosphate nucleotidase CysQ [Methylobacterium sp. V23]